MSARTLKALEKAAMRWYRHYGDEPSRTAAEVIELLERVAREGPRS